MSPKKKTARSASDKKKESPQGNKPIDHINDGYVVLDAEGTIIYISEDEVDPKKGKRNKEDLIGKNAWEEIFEDASQDFINACQSATKSGKPVFLEEYFQPWERHFISRIYPSPKGLTIYFSDITEKKAIEQELKQMLNLIEESQEIAHFSNWYLDIQKEEFQFSDEMFRILGVLKDDFTPSVDAFMQLVHSDDLEALETWFDQSKAGVKPGPLEIRIVRPKNGMRWIRIDGRLAPGQEGQADRMIGFALDITERRIAQEESWEKQKNIESIIETSPSIISILDIEKNDPAYLHYGLKNSLGYSEKQIKAMKGRYAAEITEPGFIELYRNVIQKKYDDLKDGEIIEYECKLKNSKGEWRDILNREVVFSRNPDGTPAQVISFGTDITGRKKVELEVRENKAFIEKIVNSVPNVIFIYDVNKGMPVFTNLGIGGFLGYNDEEIKAMGDNHIQVVMHPDDLARFKIHNYGAYQTLRDEDVLEFDARLRTKDGEWRNFFSKEYVFSRNPDGTVAQIIGIVTDVTESRKLENELREKNAFIESILNASTDIIYIFDIESKLEVFSNIRVEEYLGYSQEDVDDMGSELLNKVLHPEDYKKYMEEVLPRYSTLKDGEPITGDYRMRRKDGKYIRFHSKESVYKRNADGKPIQIFGMLTKISDSPEK